MHALIAAWLGRGADAWRLWQDAVGLDLRPPAAAEGIHAACAGANWQVVVFGFAGIRTRLQSDVLRVAPRLTAKWKALRFPFHWCGQPLGIEIERGRVRIDHRGDAPIAAEVCGTECTLAPGRTHEVRF